MGRRPFALAAVAVIFVISVAGPACRETPGAARDGGADGVKSDGPSAFTLEITVTGCASHDAALRLCTGWPPLALSFSPVGSPELTQFLWKFSDGTPNSTERAPSHTYAHPDTYVVFLTGSAGDPGSVPANPLTVDVQPVAAGAPCDIDDQCADGLTCVCAPGSGCAAAFIRGICSTACESTACPSGATCGVVAVGLETGGPPAPRCFGACDNAPCPAGFVCQTVPAGSTSPPGPRWTRACLPLGLVTDLGGSCRSADDVLVDDACASGLCGDQGALGVCTATCADTTFCPAGSACSDSPQRCLLTCQTDADCAPDPLLACVTMPEATGLSPSGVNVNVCATLRCSSDATCEPSGHCGPNGLCVRGPR